MSASRLGDTWSNIDLVTARFTTVALTCLLLRRPGSVNVFLSASSSSELFCRLKKLQIVRAFLGHVLRAYSKVH